MRRQPRPCLQAPGPRNIALGSGSQGRGPGRASGGKALRPALGIANLSLPRCCQKLQGASRGDPACRLQRCDGSQSPTISTDNRPCPQALGPRNIALGSGWQGRGLGRAAGGKALRPARGIAKLSAAKMLPGAARCLARRPSMQAAKMRWHPESDNLHRQPPVSARPGSREHRTGVGLAGPGPRQSFGWGGSEACTWEGVEVAGQHVAGSCTAPQARRPGMRTGKMRGRPESPTSAIDNRLRPHTLRPRNIATGSGWQGQGPSIASGGKAHRPAPRSSKFRAGCCQKLHGSSGCHAAPTIHLRPGKASRPSHNYNCRGKSIPSVGRSA